MDTPSKELPTLDLDNGFCSFLKNLPQNSESCLRLFERDRGEYYSAHGDDALFVAEHVYKTNSVLKYLGTSPGIPSCTISYLNTVQLIRELLLEKQYRVEIWGSSFRKSNDWRIIKKASPGNLQDMEDMIFVNNNEVSSNPIVMAIKISMKNDQKTVGIAYADATTMRKFGVSEFSDNDTFSNFESLLIQLSVRECIVPDDATSFELKKIKSILSKCDILMTEAKRGDFHTKDIEQDLARLLADDKPILQSAIYDLKLALGSLAALIKYLSLMTDEANFGQYVIEHHDLSQYMRLDAAALKALTLMPSATDAGNKTMSVYGILNKCKTTQGSRMLAQWLKQPLMNLADIVERQNIVETLYQDIDLRHTLQSEQLKYFPDINRMAKRFQKGTASLQDVVRIYQVVCKLPELLETLSQVEGPHKKLIENLYCEKLAEFTEIFKKLQELVETTVDLDAIANHEFLIKADFDPELTAVRERLDATLEAITPEAERVADNLNVELDKKLKLEKSTVFGWCLRLTRTDAHLIRNVRGYIELATQKAGVYFTTVKLRDLSTQFTELSNNYESLQSNLVKEIITICASFFPVLEQLNELIAHLDVLTSFATAAADAPIPYVRPTLSPKGSGDLNLIASRHPCLELQNDVAFIPNDVIMGRGESSFQIITGPNMGGKSTYIRQIGVISLMSQIGSFVPCKSATLPIFDATLARVGAGDSQMRGVSTFMAEMLETASILRAASSDSLVIIDELGRGTSTYDGFGLAWAISEYIATQIRAFCLFATHFHELTKLADEEPTVKNLHVSAHATDDAITLLYRVMPGVCDQSFGIHVAELAKFPQEVVKLAKRKAAELEDFSSTGKEMHPPWKSSPTEIEEGNAIIHEFLTAFSSTPNLDTMSEEEVATTIRGLKDRFKDKLENSPFIKEVLVEI